MGPEFVSNILYKITLYTTAKLSEKCTKVKKKENGPEFVYIKGEKQSSNAYLGITPYTNSFRKCKNMKIILENAGAKCTTN